MADTKEAGVSTSDIEEYDVDDYSTNAYSYSDDVHYYLKEISDLVIKARLQTEEADIRAKYAVEFAKRAAAEAESVHQVSAALARTSRMVAALALEFSDNTGELIDSFNDSRIDSNYSSVLEGDSSFQSNHGDSNSYSECMTNSPKKVDTDTALKPKETGTVLAKYQAKYPEVTLVDEFSKEKALPTVWEDLESGERNLIDDDKEICVESEQDPADESIINSDIRRKMLLYRDSKIASSKLSRCSPDHPIPSSITVEKRPDLSPGTPTQVACM